MMKRSATRTWLEGLQLFLVLGTGHFITLLGSAMSRFAFGVWVYQSTGRVSDFAMVLVVGFLPGILVSPLAGVWADRKGPRTMVLTGDVLGAAAIATMLPAALAHSFTIPHLLIVTAILSCASALQAPAMLAIIPTIVPEAKVEKANGIFSTLQATTEMAGPALAGILVAMGAFGTIILSDLISYGAAILVTLLLWAKLAPRTNAAASGTQASGEQSSWWRDLVEGERYILVNRPLLHLILLFTILNVGIGFLGTMVPPFTLTMGNARDFGFVNGGYGLGMVLGGLVMTVWNTGNKRIRLILWGCLILGLAISGGGLARTPLMVGIAVSIVGLLIPIVNTMVVTLLQLRTNPSYLGRVFAMARMLAWITLPIGQLVAGRLADTLQSMNAHAPFLPPGRQGAYGLILFGTGLFFVLSTAVYARVKSLYRMDEEGTLEQQAA